MEMVLRYEWTHYPNNAREILPLGADNVHVS